jgi:tRNA pseudouridine38-40 synthase
MRTFRLQIAYDGSRFFGWQRQDGFASVQQALEEALLSLTGQAVTVHGAGRTDTGVHALAQVAHVHLETRLDGDRLRHAINAHVADGVVVRRAEACREGFHARFDARSKRYMYLTVTSRFPPPFARAHCHWVSYPLDLARMRAAAAALIGEHDFRAFGNTGSPRATTVRKVSGLRFLPHARSFAFVVQANGFLYNMVRTIAGTLLEVGRGKLDPACVARALASGERDELGATAPPNGLYLVSVQYDEPAFSGPDLPAQRRPGLFTGGVLAR